MSQRCCRRNLLLCNSLLTSQLLIVASIQLSPWWQQWVAVWLLSCWYQLRDKCPPHLSRSCMTREPLPSPAWVRLLGYWSPGPLTFLEPLGSPGYGETLLLIELDPENSYWSCNTYTVVEFIYYNLALELNRFVPYSKLRKKNIFEQEGKHNTNGSRN